MPIYHRLGELPTKRHSLFRSPEGHLYSEELMGNKRLPGRHRCFIICDLDTSSRVQEYSRLKWDPEADRCFRHRHFRTAQLPSVQSLACDRVPVLYNDDVAISVAAPEHEDGFFFRNAQGDEIVYVTQGEGVLETIMGDPALHPGDYIVIP